MATYGTHDVVLLSTAFAKATRAAESDKYEQQARDQFKAIARLIWESCGSNAGAMYQQTRELLDIKQPEQGAVVCAFCGERKAVARDKHDLPICAECQKLPEPEAEPDPEGFLETLKSLDQGGRPTPEGKN